jgi:hypothetical protein
MQKRIIIYINLDLNLEQFKILEFHKGILKTWSISEHVITSFVSLNVVYVFRTYIRTIMLKRNLSNFTSALTDETPQMMTS